jgi:hypothetical protein
VMRVRNASNGGDAEGKVFQVRWAILFSSTFTFAGYYRTVWGRLNMTGLCGMYVRVSLL